MKRLLAMTVIAAAATSTGKSQSTPQPEHHFWSKGETHCFSTATADERRLELSTASRHDDELLGDYMFTNASDKTPVPPTVTIRGIQLPDGTFWPPATLEVSDDPKGPWRQIGTSIKIGSEVIITVPASIGVFGLKVDFAAFKPFLAAGGWGRVTLASGESAVLDLKFLRDDE